LRLRPQHTNTCTNLCSAQIRKDNAQPGPRLKRRFWISTRDVVCSVTHYLGSSRRAGTQEHLVASAWRAHSQPQAAPPTECQERPQDACQSRQDRSKTLMTVPERSKTTVSLLESPRCLSGLLEKSKNQESPRRGPRRLSVFWNGPR
jgi:hypothetical protein